MTAELYGVPTGVDLALRALRRHPARTAFAWDGGTLSYAGAVSMIGRMQAAMEAAGLKKGMRMALLSANRADSWCAGVAAQAQGLIITWLHPIGSLDDHLDVLADGEIDSLVIDAANYRDRGGELATRAAVKHVFTIGAANYGTDLLAAAEAAGEASPRSLVGADDYSSLAYTGGTTGKSKGAIRRHASWSAVTTSILANFELPRDPRYLAVAPITHVAGTKVMPTLVRGGTVHLMKGFDPERLLATIQQQRINMTLLVPTMIYVLLDHPALEKTDLSSLELLMYGASPMSPTRLVEGLKRIGPVFSQLYGQTEGYPLSVLGKADHDPARPELFASCGHPCCDVEVRLLDDDLREVPAGEAGEICARGAQVMEGYWKRPEQTAETFKGGWLHTGDIARADERGYLYIVDRKKDMIVTGGFNVFPREVEDVLTAHPGVAMAAVIGVPDPKWGEAVTALVVPRPGAVPDAAALIQLVKDRKGPAQAPKRVEFVEALPLTAVGKVDKKVLRAKFWAGQQRMVG
jgi:fatty-acyl-CoA synthase